uniref:Uncharacterized protein n=1 Tax=Romanomermis culicivorax TaxID=13658 RepID=A0A915KJY2_ROMCU
MLNHRCRQWTLPAALWRKPVPTCGPQQFVATSPTTTTTGAQTLAAIAQQQPVAKAFGEPLPAV